MNWIREEALLFSHPGLRHLFIRAGVLFLIVPGPDLHLPLDLPVLL